MKRVAWNNPRIRAGCTRLKATKSTHSKMLQNNADHKHHFLCSLTFPLAQREWLLMAPAAKLSGDRKKNKVKVGSVPHTTATKISSSSSSTKEYDYLGAAAPTPLALPQPNGAAGRMKHAPEHCSSPTAFIPLRYRYGRAPKTMHDSRQAPIFSTPSIQRHREAYSAVDCYKLPQNRHNVPGALKCFPL